MKIRNGFVSNSSSSSFIIDGTKTTCVDVAIDMVSQMYEEYNDDNEKLYIERLKKLENKNIGIFIEYSDDLCIFRHGNDIHVDATYHIDWDLEYIKEYGEYVDFYDIMKGSDYYFPAIDNKIVGKLFDDEDDKELLKKYNTTETWLYKCKNPNCENKSRFIVKEKQIFCPNCLHDVDGVKVAFRKDKLKRIINNE
jgi:hypothetical protein